MNDEFYIGYEGQAGATTSRFTRRVVIAVSVVLLGTAGLLASQQTYDASRFEFGQSRTLVGTLSLVPYPMLHTEAGETMLLVAVGKTGWTHGVEGQQMQLSGTLIERGDTRMLEVTGAGEVVAPGSAVAETNRRNVRLSGEITGSKCYLGVMNPGRGVTHRACARACIQGGVPPMLHAVLDDGSERHILLSGASIIERVLPHVAKPVEISGSLWRIGSQWVMEVDDVTQSTNLGAS